MAVQTKEIKARLKSIKNTQKVTHTMELVSAAKMRRAISSALETRPYAHTAFNIIERLLNQDVNVMSTKSLMRFFAAPQTQEGKKMHTTMVVFTSNRGLCGGFNSQLVKKVVHYTREHANEDVHVIGVGKKGIALLAVNGVAAEQAYEKADSATSDASIRAITTQLYKSFAAGETDKVVIAFTDFVSSITQKPTIKQLYPFIDDDTISQTVDEIEKKKEKITKAPFTPQYIYEPAPADVIGYLLPRIAEVQVYQALLESNASEHSARMMAMKNATDAAADIGSELSIAYNKARQDDITREIAEISAGSAAIAG